MDRYRQYELPETVERYKAYTDSFQEWLMKTAMQRGVESAAYIAEQAKKKKKGKGVYKMSLKQQQILVDGITSSKQPLTDTSGLRDLKDAIRSRKEVAQFHKISDAEDEGHSFLNILLQAAYTNLTTFVQLINPRLKSQGLEDEASTFLVFRFDHDEADDSDVDENVPAENGPNEERAPANKKRSLNEDEKARTSPQKKNTKIPLSQAEMQLQRNFKVLCFLYEFNRVRGIVRETWMLYHKGMIGIISAALVTDLAQSHVKQSVAALTEDLISSEDAPAAGFLAILQQLYVGLSVSGISAPMRRKSKKPQSLQLSESALRHIFCMNAIEQLEAYRGHDSAVPDGTSLPKGPEFPAHGFLRFFNAIRQKKLKVPIWDSFTEAVVRSADLSDVYLPFGFQLVLDVHEIVHENYQTIFRDINGHGMDIAKLIRTHVDYEDKMWDIDKKPDYMTKGNVKFSNVFLTSLDSLLNWIQELLKDDKTSASDMTAEEFITTHPTLAGLTMYSFNKTYHGFSIAKVGWFITNLAHLYNAALQVGGLKHLWRDLDFIIEAHGARRIFVGGPPTDPQDFFERYMMSTLVSSRAFSKDFRSTGKYYPCAPAETKSKRGLMNHFPLEDTLAKYYGRDKDNDRWIRRHQVFNHLKQICEQTLYTAGGASTTALGSKELRETFSAIVKKMQPPKSKARRNKSSRTQAPDFNNMEDTYAALFQTMRTELVSHELHSNFDYLAFYRRAYAVVLKIRNEVLFSSSQQLVRYGNMLEQQEPDNQQLLSDLLRGLKIKPKDKKIEATGDEVSKDVVPLDQLKRIAVILGDFIEKEGSMELNRAKVRYQRDWDQLTASYDRQEAREAQNFYSADEDQAQSQSAPTQQGEHGGQDPIVLPNGSSTKAIPENNPTNPPMDSNVIAGAEQLPGQVPKGDFTFTGTKHRSGQVPKGEFTFTAAEHLPGQVPTGNFTFTGSNPFGSWKSGMGSAQPVPELANVFGKPHQAYVSDEAEEDENPQDHGTLAPAPSHETDEDIVECPDPLEPAQEDFSIEHKASSAQLEDMTSKEAIVRGAESATQHEDQPKSSSATFHVSKHNGKPKGIQHRIDFSSTSLRKRTITIIGKGKSTRLIYSPRRNTRNFYFISVARKRTISFPCYGLCSFTRLLLGKKTTQQIRLRTTPKRALT